MKIRGAVLHVGVAEQKTETFKLQNLYLDASSYNNMTGEKYENVVMLQNINSKNDLSTLLPGEVIDCAFRVNGRFWDKEGGSKGFSQNLNLLSFEKAKNTAGDYITLSPEQLIQVEVSE